MYIIAPAETKLAVTMQSQTLTSLLQVELSKRGFSMKELPVEVPEGQDNGGTSTFFVSLSSLKHLRDEYGLKAIVLGNAYFLPDRVDPTRFVVAEAYLRVIDTETLDVLCYMTLTDTYGGDDLDKVATAFAQELAGWTNTTPVK